MKKILFTILGWVCIIPFYGQWTTSGADISNTNSGSIGIGTSAATERVTILDANDAMSLGLYRAYSGASSAGTYLNFGALDGLSNKVAGAAILGHLKGNKTSGGLSFYTKNNSVLAEALTIDNQQNIGLGVSEPHARLEVNGNIFMSSQSNYIQFGTDAGTAPYIIGNSYGDFVIGTQNTAKVYLLSNGRLGIGTASPAAKLSVEGNTYINGNMSANGIVTTEKLTITQVGWSDYVLRPSYKLRSVSKLESYIKTNYRLPEMPSEKEIHQIGISVGENQALLLKKIEELTLYVIDLQRQLTSQAKKIRQLQQKN